MATPQTVVFEDIRQASNRIRDYVHKTPVMTSTTLDRMATSAALSPIHLVFKCENFQKVGAFKYRGATNAIRTLIQPLEATEGSRPIVITHSSGNHAQALALAAKQQGVTCHVVMPRNAPLVKKDAVRGYGAIVTECEPTLQAREDTVKSIRRKLAETEPDTKVEFISPYDDIRVIAGQGTLALELIEQARELETPLDVLITPVGGGGMLSGCATAAKGVKSDIWVIGAEPKGADDAHHSFYSKEFQPSENPNTIADGLLTSLGSHTFPLILQHVDAIHTVTEDQIILATKLVYERMKIVIEPSAAVSLAVALYSQDFHNFVHERGRPMHVGIVFSGGNADILKLALLFQSVENFNWI